MFVLQDGLLLILHSINDFLRERNESSPNDVFVKNSEGCDVINDDILLQHITVRGSAMNISSVSLNLLIRKKVMLIQLLCFLIVRTLCKQAHECIIN